MRNVARDYATAPVIESLMCCAEGVSQNRRGERVTSGCGPGTKFLGTARNFMAAYHTRGAYLEAHVPADFPSAAVPC
jgi:hypothetical protein